ncbi:MAG TPA: EamA family transporter, partial [Polyangia bacterium]|nr:EamA family transporter [Polyangia bacterium]
QVVVGLFPYGPAAGIGADGTNEIDIEYSRWGIVFASGDHHAIPRLSGRSVLFLALSGVATGLSGLAYFRALQLGPASRVAPIDKLSLALTLVLSAVVLHESISWKVALGVALMVGGALLTIAG